eukprot:GHVH01006589.1.p1 GENE.GHVH01006589.1~~GHVH01006589.1.p1  ORF type:complete len:210 (+),score=23.19 GHVH01006589.1:154-783(+)
MECNLIYKVVLIGDTAVGKSNLLCRFTRNHFNMDSKSTIGVEFATKTLRHEDGAIKAQIWDTAGQERYRSITRAYYRGSVGAIVVFDLTRKSTLLSCSDWINELRYATVPDIPVILVGNKTDLVEEREVTFEEAEEFAKQEGYLKYVETSALTAHNVEFAFTNLIISTHESQRIMRGDAEKRHTLPDASRIDLKDKKTKKSVFSKWCNI